MSYGSMTGSMCRSMTGRPTRAQIANEQKRQSYGYYQNAMAIRSGVKRSSDTKEVTKK